MFNNYNAIKVINHLNQEVVIKLDEEVTPDDVETYYNELTFEGLIDANIEYGNEVVITLLEQMPNLKGVTSIGVPLPEFETEEVDHEEESPFELPDPLRSLFSNNGNILPIPLGNGKMAGILRIPRKRDDDEEEYECDCSACRLSNYLSDLKDVVTMHAIENRNPMIIDSVFDSIYRDIENRFPHALEDKKIPFRESNLTISFSMEDLIPNPENETLSKETPREILNKVLGSKTLPEGTIHPLFKIGEFLADVVVDPYGAIVIMLTDNNANVLMERYIGTENVLNKSRDANHILRHILKLANALN